MNGRLRMLRNTRPGLALALVMALGLWIGLGLGIGTSHADSGRSPPQRSGGAATQHVKPTPAAIQAALTAMCGFLDRPPLVLGGTTDAKCERNGEECRTSYNVQSQSVPDKPSCRADWTALSYIVEKRIGAILVWSLQSLDPPAPAPRYAFLDVTSDPNVGGISMCPQSKNDPAQDLRDGRCVGPLCQAYRWTAVNRRERSRLTLDPPLDASGTLPHAALHFAPLIYRTDTGEICEAGDPPIVIRGE